MIQIRKFDLDEKIYDPELGDGISSTEYIFEHYYNSKNPENFFISFTEIDKLGINPQSKYETPLGIYTYPVKEFFETYVAHSKGPVDRGLNIELKSMKIGKFAPFAGEHRWVWVVEIDRSKGKVFDIAEYNERDYEEDVKFLATEKYRDIIVSQGRNGRRVLTLLVKEIDPSLSDSEAHKAIANNEKIRKEALINYLEIIGNESKYSSIAGRMWNITRIISKKDPIQWNKLFREMGYICAIDRQGEGVIHEMEKTQAVFFQRKYFNVIDKVENIRAAKSFPSNMPDLPGYIAKPIIDGMLNALELKKGTAQYFFEEAFTDISAQINKSNAYNIIGLTFQLILDLLNANSLVNKDEWIGSELDKKEEMSEIVKRSIRKALYGGGINSLFRQEFIEKWNEYFSDKNPILEIS